MPDIVAIIGASVELKRRGGIHVGLCPFHSEKTPSFYVYPAPARGRKPFFRCYGCDAHGDVIDWIRLLRNCSYHEAREFLGMAAAYKPDPALQAERLRQKRLEALWQEHLAKWPCWPDYARDLVDFSAVAADASPPRREVAR